MKTVVLTASSTAVVLVAVYLLAVNPQTSVVHFGRNSGGSSLGTPFAKPSAPKPGLRGTWVATDPSNPLLKITLAQDGIMVFTQNGPASWQDTDRGWAVENGPSKQGSGSWSLGRSSTVTLNFGRGGSSTFDYKLSNSDKLVLTLHYQPSAEEKLIHSLTAGNGAVVVHPIVYVREGGSTISEDDEQSTATTPPLPVSSAGPSESLATGTQTEPTGATSSEPPTTAPSQTASTQTSLLCSTIIKDPKPPAHVRDAPNGSVIQSLSNGTPISVSEELNGWLHVTFPTSGWVYAPLTARQCGSMYQGWRVTQNTESSQTPFGPMQWDDSAKNPGDQSEADNSLPSQVAASSAAPQSQVKVVQRYYSLWNQKNFTAMYQLLSARFQQKHPYSTYPHYHSLTDAISVVASTAGVPSDVNVRIHSQDHDDHGNVSQSIFEGSWHLVLQNGEWKLDSEDIHQVQK
jgi:hypothetical protein